MQVTLETLQQHTPDGIKVAIPELTQSVFWSLEGALRLLRLPTFERLVKAWEIAGNNTSAAEEYQRLAQPVQEESHVSATDLRLILEWYYREFVTGNAIPKQ